MKKTLLKILMISFLFLPNLLITTPLVLAQTDLFPEEVCNAETRDSPVCQEEAQQQASDTDPVAGPKGIISDAANIIALVAGVAAVLIIIYSGYVFATSGGSIGGQRAGDNPARAQKARSTLLGAVIGLTIIALAWVITRFIIDRVL